MTRRDRIGLTVILVAAALGAFWFLGLGSKRKDADRLGSLVSTQQTRRDQARQRLAVYQAARGAYRTNYATVARLGKAVPATNDVPSLIYQVESTAEASGIEFESLKVSASTAPPTPAPATVGSSDSEASSSGTSATTATTTSGTAVGTASFTTVPFAFTFQGSFFKLSTFFKHLQDYIQATNKRVTVSGRLMTLDGIDLAAGPKGFPQITANATATTYLVPADQGLFNGANASTPSTAATTTAGAPAAGASALSPGTATVLTK